MNLSRANTRYERETLERTIAATDRQIDALVYALYGLSKDEVRIVEGAAGSPRQAGSTAAL